VLLPLLPFASRPFQAAAAAAAAQAPSAALPRRFPALALYLRAPLAQLPPRARSLARARAPAGDAQAGDALPGGGEVGAPPPRAKSKSICFTRSLALSQGGSRTSLSDSEIHE
jgi:hypothetical protein